MALRIVHAESIRLHHGITIADPKERIGRLEPRVARDLDLAESHAGHAHEEGDEPIPPLVLAVWCHRHEHRRRPAVGRSKEICAENDAVAHRHGKIALEYHIDVY